jgi:MraZ protein
VENSVDKVDNFGVTAIPKPQNLPNLFGPHKSTCNDKGRMSFPAEFREELGDSFFIAKNIKYPCLTVYSVPDWEHQIHLLNQLPPTDADALRVFLVSSSAKASPDAQGRIFISPMLRSYAHIKDDVWVVGVGSRGQIWDMQTYDEVNAASARTVQDIALKYGF